MKYPLRHFERKCGEAPRENSTVLQSDRDVFVFRDPKGKVMICTAPPTARWS
jgi:hypothetical protein